MTVKASQALVFYAFYTASKVGKTGLTVTIDVYKGAAAIVTAGSATELGGGMYGYTLAGASTADAAGYFAVFKTADATVDAQHVPSLWVVGTLVATDAATPGALMGLADNAITPAKITAEALAAIAAEVNADTYPIAPDTDPATGTAQAALAAQVALLTAVKPDNKPTVNAGGASLVSNPAAVPTKIEVDFDSGKVEIS
jgi:hypothetical protein